MNLVDYADRALRMYPVQRVVLKLMAGVPLSDRDRVWFEHPLTGGQHNLTEADYLRFLQDEGRASPLSDGPVRQLVLAAGRRTGKSVLHGIIAAHSVHRLTEMADPHVRYGIENGTISVGLIGPNQDQSMALHKEATWHTEMDDRRFVHRKYDETTRFLIHNGKYVVLTSTPANIAHEFFRGSSLFHVGIDELGYGDGVIDILNTVLPSLLQFAPKYSNRLEGQFESTCFVTFTPTPHDSSRYAYALYQSSFELSPGVQFIGLRIPTWELNPTLGRDFYLESHGQDPDSFHWELGANLS